MIGLPTARQALLIIASTCAAASAAPADTPEPMGAVRQYIDAFNKGDMEAMAATCAVPASILDGRLAGADCLQGLVQRRLDYRRARGRHRLFRYS